MSQPIKQRLESSLSTAAPSGRAIASYMLANLYELPFQTAADIASKLGVSESSVGRFCRALGYIVQNKFYAVALFRKKIYLCATFKILFII